jgi:hypothetical protein
MNLKLVSFVALCGAFAVACGDSGSNTAGGPAGGGNPDGGGGDGGSSGVLAGGNDPVGAGGPVGGSPPEEPDCYDEGEAKGFEDGTFSGVTVDQGVCTPAQIQGAYDACFAMTATEATCTAFNDDVANTACAGCLYAGQETAPFPMMVTLQGTAYTYLTLYACQAVAMDLPECAVPVQLLLFCGNTACEACADDDTENNECVNYAINPPGICGDIALPEGCEAVLAAQELDPVCIGDATTFDAAFLIMCEHYCGAP